MTYDIGTNALGLGLAWIFAIPLIVLFFGIIIYFIIKRFLRKYRDTPLTDADRINPFGRDTIGEKVDRFINSLFR